MLNQIRRLARNFAKASDGNVMMLFGLSVIPVIGMMGAAIDYGRASTDRTLMQAALDDTALAISQQATALLAQDPSGKSLTQKANTIFAAQFASPDVSGVSLTANYSEVNGSHVTLTAHGGVSTAFMKIMGFNNMSIGTSSTASWGNTRLRVALVLDNTGSMSDDGKMAALKPATTALLAQLKAAAKDPEDVYVSMIPFVSNVNIGKSNYNASWIDWTDWNTAHKTCNWQGTCTVANHNSWDGGIMDRAQPYDASNVTPSGGSNFPAHTPKNPQGGDTSVVPLQLQGLTNNWTTLNGMVGNMVANGGTNQAVGIAWGWQSLTTGTPLTVPAEDPDPKYQYEHFIMLMSDGLNTEDRWYGNGSDQSSDVDARQHALCAQVHSTSPNLKIIALQVNTGSDPASTIMQYCASVTGGYYQMIRSSADMGQAFAQAGDYMTQLHLSQ